MRPETKELKRFVRQVSDQPAAVRIKRDNFEVALRIAIEKRSADDRAQGMLFDSAWVAGWKTILKASQNGQHIIVED
jgi:hypothetical protein